MPRYDYQCESCGHVFEVTRKRKDPGPSECPQCQAPDPQKLISATSFKLTGSGWYATDYRSPGLAKGVGTMPDPVSPKDSKSDTDSSSGSSDTSDSSSTSDASTPSGDAD